MEEESDLQMEMGFKIEKSEVFIKRFVGMRVHGSWVWRVL